MKNQIPVPMWFLLLEITAPLICSVSVDRALETPDQPVPLYEGRNPPQQLPCTNMLGA